jgi:hypothetical protein
VAGVDPLIRALIAGLAMSCAATGPSMMHNRHAGDDVRLGEVADDALAAILRPNYHRPFDPRDVTYAPIRALYLDACHAGNRRACWMIPQVRDPGTTSRDPSMDDVIANNCAAGDLTSCRALWRYDQRRGVPGWMGRSQCASESSCDLVLVLEECASGLAQSCETATGFDGVSDSQRRTLHARFVELIIDGCRQGLIDECEQVLDLRDLRDRPGVRAAAASRVCQLRGDHCVDAFDKPEDPGARDLLEHGCQLAAPGIREILCGQLVFGYARQAWPEPVPNRFRDLRDWYCRNPVYLDHRDICVGADLQRTIEGR